MFDVTELLMNDPDLSGQVKGGQMPGEVPTFFSNYVD